MRSILILLSITLFIASETVSQETFVNLNSVGYLPEMPKKATLTKKNTDFSVINARTGKTVFRGKTSGPFYQEDVAQEVWIADFSKFSAKGKYYLQTAGAERSPVFEIGNHIYDSVYYTTMRAFYLWRCGTEVEGTYRGEKFHQEICHLEDGYLDYIGHKDSLMDGTGGWHDAGDYGKYTVNAGITIANLLFAWDHFNDKIGNFNLDLPETARDFPDFLKEIKWETDWLLKMQYPDSSGRISHKLTSLRFHGFVMPAEDTAKRFFTEWSSAATANFAATMAMAARYFRKYDPSYAELCLKAAKKSYLFLKENPEEKKFKQGDFRTGSYYTADWDDRLWASAELWETTGEGVYLKDFEEKATSLDRKIDENWDWGDVKNMGMFTYLLSKRQGKDQALLKEIKNELFLYADSIVHKAGKDIYGRSLGNLYYWGSAGGVVRQAIHLNVAFMLSQKPEYLQTITSALNHVFGRNFYGRSFVTGIGHKPPMFPHDRRSGGDNTESPWPGYIIGGGTNATNWKDEEPDFRTNEIAINWQAPLVYAVACFVNHR
jgi:endoglucanase